MGTERITESADLALRIRREQIRLLYANLYNGWIATPLCALLVALIMRESASGTPLIAWLSAIMGVSALRLWSNIEFNKVRDGEFDCRKWEYFFMRGAGAAGVLWGSTMTPGFFPDSIPVQVFILLLVAGLTAGTTMAYSARWHGPAWFGLPAMVPFTVRFFWHGDPMHAAMGFATLIFVILNTSITRNGYATVLRSLKLMFENTALVAGLQSAREHQAHDFEALKSAKEKAETATKLKDEFVAVVSHDLKSPLLSMKNLLELAEKSSGGLAELEKKGALARMRGTTGTLLNMIDHILNHNRLKSGRVLLEKKFIGAKRLADAHMNAVGHDAARKNITLINDLPEDMFVFADAVLLGQVLHNLLTNAVKFTPSDGEIAVFAPYPGKPGISVRDTGVGIPKNLIGRLFDGNVNTTTPGTEGEKGTGLGLPYAFDVMREHGGTLEVESSDGGSTFTASLPEHRTMVLIVDDYAIYRNLIRDMLLTIGDIEVVEAENGKQAVETLGRITPDLIVTDIQMPEMNGYALMEHVRADPTLRAIPIIAVSGNAVGDGS